MFAHTFANCITVENCMPYVGLPLQLFSHWYDLDVIEEDAFLKWKEDISQEGSLSGKHYRLFVLFTRKNYHLEIRIWNSSNNFVRISALLMRSSINIKCAFSQFFHG